MCFIQHSKNFFLIVLADYCVLFCLTRSGISKIESVDFWIFQILNLPIEIRSLDICQVLLALTQTRDKKSPINAWNDRVLKYFQLLSEGFKVWDAHSKKDIWLKLYIWDSLNDLPAFSKTFCFNNHNRVAFPCVFERHTFLDGF